MTIKKLSTTDGFVRFDFDDAPSVGIVRSAPKILQGGAEWLARSITYSFASFEIQQGGASAGVNAAPDDRADAIAAFVSEVMPMVADGSYRPDAGKGVPNESLAELRTGDARPDLLWAERDGVSGADELSASGVVAGVERGLGALDGKTVVIEGFNATGLAVARQLAEAGATVVGVGTPKGAATSTDGFSPDQLASTFAEHGDAMVNELGVDAEQHLKIFGAPCDALCVGSKAGALTHQGAAYVRASAVVGTGPSPMTTKAFVVLRQADKVVIPEFLTIAGPLLVGAEGDQGNDLAGLCSSVRDRVGASLDEVAGHPEGHFLGAAERAETFLDTWREQRPFGRPLA